MKKAIALLPLLRYETGMSMQISHSPDHDFDEGAIEAARILFAGSCDFLLGVAALDQLPVDEIPEIAFAGRSNVGKSSLINALTGRKALARTSNTPGRTQQLNFFNLGGVFYLVDMPGYGYAEAPVAIVAKWQALLKSYLSGRQTLRRAFVLIDARHGVKAVDEEIMDLLDRSAVTFQAVMTKADKISKAELEKNIGQTRAALANHPAAYPELIVCERTGGGGRISLSIESAEVGRD